MEKPVKEMVLTGGPCSGKTTGKNYAYEKLRDRGIRAFYTPEVATMIIEGGVRDIAELRKNDFKKFLDLEKQIFLAQLDVRRRFNAIAEIFEGERRVILFDRAEMDILAYVPEEYLKSLFEEAGLNIYGVRNSYDAVIHLVTAARGAEQFYTKANNRARQEDLEEARITDELIKNAWTGHPHLRIINNTVDFEHKLRRLLQVISRALGIPVPLEIERKFLLQRIPDFGSEHFRHAQKISIEQMYLVSPTDQQIRIRKRTQDGFSDYYKTCKVDVSSGVRQEAENAISPLDYTHFQAFKDPASRIIRKNRYCFVYNDQYFELDVFMEPRPGLCVLEIELTEENDKLELPPFLDVEREITGDPTYSNYGIAKES